MRIAIRWLWSLSLLVSACSAPAPTPVAPAPPPPAPAPIADVPCVAPPVASAAPDAPAPEAAKLPETLDLAAVDAYIARRSADMGLVGVSVAIMRNGKVVFAKGYGQSSLDTKAPVTTETEFAVGSITKQFTCASVLLLEQSGKVSLKDKVAKYYPDLTRAKDITLADLGAHVSGYPDYYPLDFTDSRMKAGISADDLIHKYASGPLDFEPGARYSYSNTGFIILGRVIEKASGGTFASFVQDRLLKPVGMMHSSVAPVAGTPLLATGYESFAMGDPRPAVREPESWMYAAGALYSTPTDLAAWDLALMDGKVLKPESLKKMTTPHPLADGRDAGYGCGLGVGRSNNETVLQHSGEVNGFLAFNTMLPRTKSAVILLTNSMYGNPGSLAGELTSLVIKDGAPAAVPPTIQGAPAVDVARELFTQLQAGTVGRAKLGAEFSGYMTDALVRDAAPRLKALGTPTAVELVRKNERGGMEHATLRFVFPARKVEAELYRSPDGKVQEFLLLRN